MQEEDGRLGLASNLSSGYTEAPPPGFEPGTLVLGPEAGTVRVFERYLCWRRLDGPQD